MERNHYLKSSEGRLDQIGHILKIVDSNLKVIEFGPGSGLTLKQIKNQYIHARITGFDLHPVDLNDDIPIIKADLNNFDFSQYTKLFSGSNVILLLDDLEHLCVLLLCLWII